jgi:hypothetical protein
VVGGDPGFELGTVGAAFAHRWVPPFKCKAPPKRLTIGAVRVNRTTSQISWTKLSESPSAGKHIGVVELVIEVVKADALFMTRRQGPLMAIAVEKRLGHAAEQPGHGQINLPVPSVGGGIEEGSNG